MPTPQRAILYSYPPIDPLEIDGILRRASEIDPPLEIVRRFVGTPAGHPLLGEAIATAVELGAVVVLVPNDEALGPISFTDVLKKYLPLLEKGGVRLRVIRGEFDTYDARFVSGIRWASASMGRKRSVRTAQWHEERKEAGAHSGRLPLCLCQHGVTRLGGDGHNRRPDGTIGPCRKPHCGCPRYRPRFPIPGYGLPPEVPVAGQGAGSTEGPVQGARTETPASASTPSLL